MDFNIDGHKLGWHLDRVSEWKKKGDSFPIYVEIGLTNICNHSCSFCGLDWARGKNTLETSILLKNLKDMATHGVKSVCYSGAGEPSLHKDFSLIIKKTKEYGIDVAFSTNVALYNEKKAKETLPHTSWIRFSVDAATSKTHAKIHRPGNKISEKDFPKIIKNLNKAVEIKTKNNYDVVLGVQFMLLEENAGEVIKAAKLFRDLGVDNLQVKPYSQNPNSINKLSLDYTMFNDLEEKLSEFNTDKYQVIYRASRAERVCKEKDYNVCYGLPFFAVINEKGEVEPCLSYYDNLDFSYGNIYQDKFSTIWTSKKRKEIIEKITKGGVHKCKKGCRLDKINLWLEKVVEGKIDLKNPPGSPPQHVNFI